MERDDDLDMDTFLRYMRTISTEGRGLDLSQLSV